MLVNVRTNSALVVFLITTCVVHPVVATEAEDEAHFLDCGGVFEEPRGVLTTPNFPEPYPAPIYCEWLIKAPTDGSKNFKIVLYLTQNYMKDSLYLTSYDYFQDTSTYVGRVFHGQIDWQSADIVVSHQRFLLVQLGTHTIANRHLRVIDHLLDVHGFNITYEILDSTADLREKTCSVKNCSYLGNCEVSANFEDFSCRCFDEFFGDSCQYGPSCDPKNGINMCLNGGECRYFVGSFINQCQCLEGYAGINCEIDLNDEQNRTQFISRDCMEMRCNYQCGTDELGNLHCICPEGFVLDKDQVTCKQIEWFRFDVLVTFTDGIIFKNQSEVDQLTSLIKDTITGYGVTTLDRYAIQPLSLYTYFSDIKFSLYCQTADLKLVPEALNVFIQDGEIYGHPLYNVEYEENPGLQLTEVMSIEPHATLRGKMMSVVCAAKGSKDMSFTWYKDGARVNTRLTLRNAWESVYQQSAYGMYLYALNIDSAMPIDQGIFTCVVEDFGEVQNMSVAVSVNNYPMVELDPMSLSVYKGTKVLLKCISPDDSWHEFTYEWLKDGIVISADSKTEYAEDILPTGVQLVVLGISEHTEYMCRVTNEVGSANVSSYVFVISDNTSAEFCPRNYASEVMWSKTAGGHFDLNLCPSEQGGKYVDLTNVDFGHAVRKCVCDSNGRYCKWEEPNMSKCQSLELVYIHDELDSLISGYMQTNVSKIFDALCTFTLSKNKDAVLYSGDMDIVSGILYRLMNHMKTFPQLMEHDKKIEAKRLPELMSAILVRSYASTDEEKASIDVGASIMSTIHTVLTGGINSMIKESPLHIQTHGMDLREVELLEVPCKECENHPIVKDSGEDLRLFVNTYFLSTKYLSNLLEHRDISNNKDKNRRKYTTVSPVISIAHSENEVDSVGPPTVRFTIQHDPKVVLTRAYMTLCLKWDYEARNLYSGHWTFNGCSTVESHSHSTVCECRLPGHFTAVAVPSNKTHDEETAPEMERNLILVVGYSISLSFIVVTAIIYIKLFSVLVTNVHAVHMSFIISIVCFTVSCLVSVTHTHTSQFVLQIICGLITFCFYVACFALMLEITTIYFRINEVKMIKLTRFRLLVACWGFPVILTVPLLVVSKKHNHDRSSYWLESGSKEFIILIATLGLHVFIYSILFFSCIHTLRKWTAEWQYSDKVRNMKSLGKNSVLYVLYLLVIIFMIDLNVRSQTTHVVLLITFHNILCIMVLLVRIVSDKKVRQQLVRACLRAPNPVPDQTINNNAFCAYMKPEIVRNVTNCAEADNVSKYYDEVNRTKYTLERKRQLSFLLGSGSSGYGTGSSESATDASIDFYGKQLSGAPSFTVNASVHSGTDGGVLIKDNSKSSSSSVGASGSVKDEVQVYRGNISYDKNSCKQLQTSLEQTLQRNEPHTKISNGQSWMSNQSLSMSQEKHKKSKSKKLPKGMCSVASDKDIPGVHMSYKLPLNDNNDAYKRKWQIDDHLNRPDTVIGLNDDGTDSDVSVSEEVGLTEKTSVFCTNDSDNDDDVSSCESKLL